MHTNANICGRAEALRNTRQQRRHDAARAGFYAAHGARTRFDFGRSRTHTNTHVHQAAHAHACARSRLHTCLCGVTPPLLMMMMMMRGEQRERFWCAVCAGSVRCATPQRNSFCVARSTSADATSFIWHRGLRGSHLCAFPPCFRFHSFSVRPSFCVSSRPNHPYTRTRPGLCACCAGSRRPTADARVVRVERVRFFEGDRPPVRSFVWCPEYFWIRDLLTPAVRARVSVCFCVPVLLPAVVRRVIDIVRVRGRSHQSVQTLLLPQHTGRT